MRRIRWIAQKIEQRLEIIEKLVYRKQKQLSTFKYLKLSGPEIDPPVSLADFPTHAENIPWGSYWGEYKANFVLGTRFHLPVEWQAEAVALYLPIGKAGDFSHPEALVYLDGEPYAACDRHHQEILLPPQYADGESHELILHGWAGSLQNSPDVRLLMRQCALVTIHQPTRDFVSLVRVTLGIANQLDEDEPARTQLYNALNAAFRCLDLREPLGEDFYRSVPQATKLLRTGVRASGEPLAVEITAVGHAHIDLAWLWTLAQTRRKAGRTYHNVLRLMEQYPEFHFTQSQPQLYEFVRQDYPELFAQIKERVKEGRWEPIGGSWVEMDCNLSGPESLARQFLLGRTFFREHFGAEAESPILWLPDVFGYAWNLPQLIKEAGLEYFFTIKIGWNLVNRLPYDSFWWQGLDGTRVLTHFSTTPQPGSRFASTYNAAVTPEQTLESWRNFQQKDVGVPGQTAPLLMSYGYGDGGGGPTRKMLDNLRELSNFPAAPRLHAGTVKEFFTQLETELGERLPVWNGELYLENHRGTYTSQSRTKRANRKSEFLLHDAEFLASWAALSLPAYQYPHAELKRAWKLVALNQFHDIIPGSSIGEVYIDSDRQYQEVRQLGEQVRDNALSQLSKRLEGELVVVNPTSFTRSDLAFWPGKLPAGELLVRPDGRAVQIQAVEAGSWLALGALPPYSLTPLTKRKGELPPMPPSLRATPKLLENALLRVEFNAEGDITRIFDKRQTREVLPEGAIANQFQLFEDLNPHFDAWNIDPLYEDKQWLAEPAETVRVVENGPLRATLEVRRRLHHSELVQRITLTRQSAQLDFETTVHWHEQHLLLKVAFPVQVLAPKATYEIQWGNVERPTHRNTSWDWARFETAAQKWVDLSEGGYGVSLLNDSKYGHDIHANVIRLSLLRGPTSPDPQADQGEHHFTYSLLPHAGGWNEKSVAAAYALNDPLLVHPIHGGGNLAHTPQPFISTTAPHVVIETIKEAEDGAGVIVRLYESQRRRGKVTLKTNFPLQAAWRTNLLEENQEKLPCTTNKITFSLRPFQIMTLRLVAKKEI